MEKAISCMKMGIFMMDNGPMARWKERDPSSTKRHLHTTRAYGPPMN